MKRFFIILIVIGMTIPSIQSVNAQEDFQSLYYDGEFSVVLPPNWVAERPSEDPEIFIGTSSDAVESIRVDETPDIPSEELAMAVIVLPLEAFADTVEDDEPDVIESAILEIIAGDFLGDDIDEELEILESRINERPISLVEVQFASYDSILSVVEVAPNFYAITFMAFASDEGETYQTTAFSVLSSLFYSYPLADSFENEVISFAFPATWVLQTDPNNPQTFVMFSNESLAEANDFQEDEFGMVLTDITDVAQDFALDEVAVLLAQQFAQEGDTISNPVQLTYYDRFIYAVGINNEDPDSAEGGLMVTQNDDGNVYVLLFLNGHGQAPLIFLSAVNTILTASAPQE